MEVEKRRSKGGFLQFFDWNSKSRKKLFSNSPDIPGPDGVKHGMDDAEILAMSRFQMNVIDENGVSSSKSESSEWNCAASETSNEGSENRAPWSSSGSTDGFGFIAKVKWSRVLHLVFRISSSRTSSYGDGTCDLRRRCDPIDYLSNSSRLGPGFVSAKNATYVMKAAVKIIKASPWVVRGKASSDCFNLSASVPLRIQDLKMKLGSSYEAQGSRKLVVMAVP